LCCSGSLRFLLAARNRAKRCVVGRASGCCESRPCSAYAGVRSRWSLTSTVAYGSIQARRAVSAHVLRIPSPSELGTVSPALVSPPWNPHIRGAPFPSGNPPGGETHPACADAPAPLKRGDTARLSSCFSTPPCAADAFRIPDNNRGPGTRLLLGWPPPRRRLANPPNPPGTAVTQASFDKLSFPPVCLPFCFGGQGRSADRHACSAHGRSPSRNR